MSILDKVNSMTRLAKQAPMEIVRQYPGTVAGAVFFPASTMLMLSGVDIQGALTAIQTFSVPDNLISNPAYFAAGVLDMTGTGSLALWSDKKIEANTHHIDLQDQKQGYKFLKPWNYPVEYMAATQYPIAACFAMAAGGSQQPLEWIMTGLVLGATLAFQVPERVHHWQPMRSASQAFNCIKDKYNAGKAFVMSNGVAIGTSLFLAVNALQVVKGVGDMYEATNGQSGTQVAQMGAQDRSTQYDNGLSFALSGAWFAMGNLVLMRMKKRAQIMPSPS